MPAININPCCVKNGIRPRLALSGCLWGEEVRYDGGHKQDRYVLDTLARYVELVPVCPEVEVGMSIPRPTVRLEGDLCSLAEGHDAHTVAAQRVEPVVDQCGADALTIGHYDGAWPDCLRAIREGIEEAGIIIDREAPVCGGQRASNRPSPGFPNKA